ncbi:MAG: transcription-repair coupling factor, partial [Chloroflexi bacterium]|nr:transcription-repair coupling factor [Chloroflexota bacterium]
IESGLDLPNVNTLIVNRADRFGLAQLYQLRGRVGRGAHRAYAYLLYERNRALTETAQKRLQAIFDATELGAGFQIALKDLEIRGAGNLLGPEQSGYIGTVGFDLYCRLLADAVERLKAEQEGRAPAVETPAPPPPSIDLPLAAHLPDDYVEDLSTRLDLYRRLAEATTPDAVEELAQEIHDRFGRMPAPTRTLLWVARLRVLATRAGVRSLTLEDGQAVVRLHEGLTVDRRALAGLKSPLVAPGTTLVRVDTRRQGPGASWQTVLEQVVEALAGAPVAG